VCICHDVLRTVPQTPANVQTTPLSSRAPLRKHAPSNLVTWHFQFEVLMPISLRPAAKVMMQHETAPVSIPHSPKRSSQNDGCHPGRLSLSTDFETLSCTKTHNQQSIKSVDETVIETTSDTNAIVTHWPLHAFSP
jgi:hypothetical protein